ncbi:hypothetical protein KAH55_06780 [bacterium]|nr:hypothetical protein [bacterium]
MTIDRISPGNQIFLGIDIGSVSTEIVLLGNISQKIFFQKIAAEQAAFSLYEPEQTDLILLLAQYQRVQGDPVRQTLDLLELLQPYLSAHPPAGISATGAGAEKLKMHLKIKSINEFRALASGVGYLLPDVTTVFEMGGDSSKYISISISKESSDIELSDYEKNGDCAAGTGSFMDQQARRLLFNIEDVGPMVLQADTAATIAGRCSVFAKSDMIHAQQNGYTAPQILKGLCETVVRNFKGTILKGKPLGDKIAFVGGVSANKGVVKAMRDIFARDEHHLLVPDYGASIYRRKVLAAWLTSVLSAA